MQMADRKLYLSDRPKNSLFTPVTRRPYCPGRPRELCFTTLSLAMETKGMRLSVVKQSFFGPPGHYCRLSQGRIRQIEQIDQIDKLPPGSQNIVKYF